MERIKLSLAAMRKNAGENVEEVHKATGISVATIYSYEQGRRKPSLRNMAKLLEHYGFEFENLDMDDYLL